MRELNTEPGPQPGGGEPGLAHGSSPRPASSPQLRPQVSGYTEADSGSSPEVTRTYRRSRRALLLVEGSLPAGYWPRAPRLVLAERRPRGGSSPQSLDALPGWLRPPERRARPALHGSRQASLSQAARCH